MAGPTEGWGARRRHRLAWMALATAALFVAAACGARTTPYLGGGVQAGQAANNGSDNSNADTGTGAGTDTGAGTGTGGPLAGGTNANPGAKTGTNAKPGQQPVVADAKSFDYSAKAEAAACAGSTGNTASDVGITPTDITLGNVSGLSGLITNSFEHGPAAVQALFSAVNAAGGICGRKLKLVVEDDGQDPARNASDVNDLKNRVFAFVGSTSDADNAGVQAMVDAKVPDVGFAINANRGQSSVFWSANGSTLYTQGNPPRAYGWNGLQNGLKEYNELPKRLAVLSYQIPISADAGRQFAYSFKQAGSQICFEDYSISPASASLDSDVLQMKQNNCDGVTTTMDISGNTKLLQSIQRQNYHMPYVAVTFVGYDPAQIDLPGQDAAQGLQVTLPFVPFTDPNPIMKMYKDQLATYQPNSHPAGFGVEAWAAGQMFIYALLKAGRNPTRASLTAAFNALTNYDTGGAFSPTTPRLRLPNGPCIVETAVKGDDFARKWPPSGMYCNAQLVPVAP